MIDTVREAQAAMVRRLQAENAALRADLALNAQMLVKQCDLARDAETEAARLQRLINEHDARVMQPGGVPYEYPVQLAVEAAAMRASLDRQAQGYHEHISGRQLCFECYSDYPDHMSLCSIGKALSGTAGQAILDELARLRAVATAAVSVKEMLDALRIEGGVGNVLREDERAFWHERAENLREVLRAAGYLKEG